MDEKGERQPTSESERQRSSIPLGYREGIITAITVFLAFSLAFFRFWGFEASGEWTVRSIIAACALVVAVVLQIVALYRSLRIEDDDQQEYRITVRWFVASIVVLLVGLLIAVFVFSRAH